MQARDIGFHPGELLQDVRALCHQALIIRDDPVEGIDVAEGLDRSTDDPFEPAFAGTLDLVELGGALNPLLVDRVPLCLQKLDNLLLGRDFDFGNQPDARPHVPDFFIRRDQIHLDAEQLLPLGSDEALL